MCDFMRVMFAIPNCGCVRAPERGGNGALTWYADGARVANEATSGRAIWRPEAPGFYEVMVIDGEGRRAQARVRIRNSG
jgi:penicillin-binding protein 1C